MSKALREMGFQGEHTTHGFRASLRTLGRERLGIDVDVLEAQLAHAPKDEVEAAYARVKFREKRREVMQRWADYLDELRSGRQQLDQAQRALGQRSSAPGYHTFRGSVVNIEGSIPGNMKKVR